jgi:hypothetical protein
MTGRQMKIFYSLFLIAISPLVLSVQAIELSDSATISVDEGPNKILAVDIDKDGKDELIVSSHPDGVISVLKLRELTRAASKITYSVGVNPSELVAFDMNNDHYKDLLIANHETNHFHILYNNKKGWFDANSIKKHSVNTKPHIHTIGAGDFNGDKLADVVIDSWENSQLAIYWGAANGNFALNPAIINVSEQPRTNLAAGDLDNDEYDDIVTPATRHNGVSVVLGATLTKTKLTNAELANTKLANTNLANTKLANTNALGAQLIANAPKAFLVKIADTNNDGNNDIITIHRNANFNDSNGEGISLLLGNGKGDFELAKGFPMTISGAPSAVVSGDINADGFPEIISTNYRTNNIAVIYYDNKLEQYQHKYFAVGLRPESIAIGDVDGDNLNEVIVANRESNTISLLRFKSRQ